jgi:hypothetical protein
MRIRTEIELEATLRSTQESGRRSWLYWHDPPPEEPWEDLCRCLLSAIEKIDESYNTIGIQQFSLNREGRIREDSIKKALFMARTATIFTSHQIIRETDDQLATETMEDIQGASWAIDHDFIRDIFRFRRAIERGELVILPRSTRTGHRAGDNSMSSTTIKEELLWLKRLERTSIINLRADTAIIDAIIDKYRHNHQLILLPEVSMPWIENIGLRTILKLRDDQSDLIDAFQRDYHKSILTHIENHRSLNFQRISQQINDDIVSPKVAEIERKYKRIIASHRSLALTGSIVSLLPISAVLIGSTLFRTILNSDIGAMIPAATANLLAVLATNRINEAYSVKALEDHEFYIIWRAKHMK